MLTKAPGTWVPMITPTEDWTAAVSPVTCEAKSTMLRASVAVGVPEMPDNVARAMLGALATPTALMTLAAIAPASVYVSLLSRPVTVRAISEP